MKNNLEQGFTFIELIAAMAVMAILLGIGIPSFSNAVKNSKIGEQSRGLIGSLYIARSEAIKRGDEVTVCARQDDTTCGTDWSNGWLVFSDADNNTTETEATYTSSTDEILDTRQPLGGNIIKSIGSGNGSIAGITTDPPNYIRYYSTGQANWQNGSFVLCDGRPEKYGRAINIVLTGDIRPGRKDATSDIPQDVFNRDIDCE